MSLNIFPNSRLQTISSYFKSSRISVNVDAFNSWEGLVVNLRKLMKLTCWGPRSSCWLHLNRFSAARPSTRRRKEWGWLGQITEISTLLLITNHTQGSDYQDSSAPSGVIIWQNHSVNNGIPLTLVKFPRVTSLELSRIYLPLKSHIATNFFLNIFFYHLVWVQKYLGWPKSYASQQALSLFSYRQRKWRKTT